MNVDNWTKKTIKEHKSDAEKALEKAKEINKDKPIKYIIK